VGINVDRRETLRAMVGVAVWSLAPRELWALAVEGPARVLDPRQLATINVAAQRIIPATHTPGAGDVHVEQFVELMLAEWYTPAERQAFLEGLTALDGFLNAAPERQTAMLESFDAEARGRADHWFARLKYLTVWGYYTSEVGQTRELGLWPLPWHYDGCAPYAV
jgi:gluconate 2-dehydrogenase gamma chain